MKGKKKPNLSISIPQNPHPLPLTFSDADEKFKTKPPQTPPAPRVPTVQT